MIKEKQMSTIYVINPINFEYNDNYYYSAGLSNPKYSFVDLKEAEKKKEQLEKEYFIEILDGNDIGSYGYDEDMFSEELDEEEFEKLFKMNYKSWTDNYYSFESKSPFNKNSKNKFTDEQIDFLFKYFQIEFFSISNTELIDVFSN